MSIDLIPLFVKNLQNKFNFWIVGGTVRDILMGKRPSDFDLTGKNIENALPYLKSEGRIVVLDRNEKEYRLILKDYWIDLSEMKGDTIEEDLKKRDFTINSMALTKDGEIIDPFYGKKDLENRLIRTVSPENITKDPIRILRAFRFMSILKFDIEEETLKTIVENRTLLQNVAGERIHQELLLILKSKNVYRTFEKMCSYKIMDILFPEITPLRETSQKYYNEQNLLFHSLQVIRYLEEKLYSTRVFYEPCYILGAFLHDIGKPLTISFDSKGNTHFHGHDKMGAKLIENQLKKLRFSGKEIEDTKNIIAFHMYPHHLAGLENLTRKAVARFLRRTGKYADFLIVFAEADARASPPREGGMPGYKRLKQLVEEIRKETKQKPERLITGYDLIDLGFTPSPLFKTILEDVDDEFKSGGLKNKKEALQYIIEKYKKGGRY